MRRDDDIATVPFYVFEAAQYRADKAVRRAFLIVGIVALANVVAWVFGLLGRRK